MTDLPRIEPTSSQRPPPVPKGRVVAPLCVSLVLLYFAFKFLESRPQGHVPGNEFVAGVIQVYGTLAGMLVAIVSLAAAMWLRRRGGRWRIAEIVAVATAWLVLTLNVVVPIWSALAD